jgi:hypothetical protein
MEESMRNPLGILLLSFTALPFIFSSCNTVKEKAPVADFKLERKLWSCDRFDIGDLKPEKLAEYKKKEKVSQGWAEYDFEVPSTGWYELYYDGVVAGWPRDLFVDGEQVINMGISGKADEVKGKRGLYKECNLYLAQGKHTLRIRRLSFPGNMPRKWILQSSKDPSGCLFARIKGSNILRADSNLSLLVTGSCPTKAAEYEIYAINTLQGTESKVGSVEFPASSEAITKTVEIPCDKEGVFQLKAKYNGKFLRPTDFRAGDFTVINTKKTPMANQVKKILIHDIDCVKQTDNGKPIKLNEGFWEAFGKTRISDCKGKAYREGGDNLDPSIPLAPKGHGQKFKSGFSYAIDVPEAQVPYLLEVDYPDDDRRTTNVIILENAKKANGLQYPAAQLGSGYETGDWFELTNKLQLHQVAFWPTTKELRVALVSMNPGMRPAASKIRVYRLEGGLPGQVKAIKNGRIFASWTEEPGRWYAYFRPFDKRCESMEADYIGIKRFAEICRYAGINAINSTEAVYQPTTYKTKELEGWFQRSHDAPRIMVLMCEKFGLKYIPELHLSGQRWFTSRVVEKMVKDPSELYIYSRLGTSSAGGGSWFAPVWNCLHPVIQDKYIRIIGELTDKLSDSPAFGGVSSRLMTWVWQSWNSLPSLNWGYGDWTVGQFEKDTGIKVPGEKNDPERFQKRFKFLCSEKMLKTWMSWRQKKVMDYFRRIRDCIRKDSPEAVLYLPYYGDEKSAMDLVFGSLLRTPRGAMEEAGIDFETLMNEPGICLSAPAGFGRRDSAPVVDQNHTDKLLNPEHKLLGKNYERGFAYGNAYFEVHTRVPIHKLGLPKLEPGAYCGAGEAGGRNILEKFSVVLADQDTNFMRIGGLGYTFGQPKFYHEWLSEYENLPKEPFTALKDSVDPVAIWYRNHDDGFYFYAVSREPYEIKQEIKLENTDELTQLGNGKKLKLKDGKLLLTLKPYQLIAFKTDSGAEISSVKTIVPQERIDLVKRRLAYCQQLADEITTGKRKNDVSDQERNAFLKQLSIAWQAFKKDHYWRARTALSMTPMIKVFQKLALYPPDQLHRKSSINTLKTEITAGYKVAGEPMISAEKLKEAMGGNSQAKLVDSETYNPEWKFTKVLKTDNGKLDIPLNILFKGKYRLSIGHVADSYGAATVSMNNKGMPILMETSEINESDRTVFPVVSLNQGKTELQINRQGSLGIYGVTLQPVYTKMPSPYWMTIGPFPGALDDFRIKGIVKQGMLKPEPPEKEINFNAEYTGLDDKKVKWLYSDKVEGDGIPHYEKSAGVAFLFRNKVQESKLCYAATFIYSPDEREAELLIGCDWWANAFINGKKIISERPNKYVENDGAYFSGWRPIPAKIKLHKGINTLLVKCQGGTVANWFTCYISDPGDLKFAPTKEKLEKEIKK